MIENVNKLYQKPGHWLYCTPVSLIREFTVSDASFSQTALKGEVGKKKQEPGSGENIIYVNAIYIYKHVYHKNYNGDIYSVIIYIN